MFIHVNPQCKFTETAGRDQQLIIMLQPQILRRKRTKPPRTMLLHTYPDRDRGEANTVLSVMFFVTCGKVSCLITAPPCVAQKGFHPFHQRKEAGKICSLLQQVAAGVAGDCTSELRIRHPSRSVT